MDEESIDFLRRLCDSHGPSGFEGETAAILREFVEKYADRVYSDRIGSLVFEKKGTAESPVVLIPGHMDEIGFIITSIDEKGYLTFHELGGWFDQILPGMNIVVISKKGKVKGTIACKPPHVLDKEEREKAIRKEKMFIDVGCSNVDEVKELGIRIGDAAVPDTSFRLMRKSSFREGKPAGERTLVFAKGLDDRIGAFLSAMTVRRLREEDVRHPNTVIGAGTAQEEVGLRGARTVANMVRPDVAVILEVDVAGDVPGLTAQQAPTKMGEGVGIVTYDATMIPNQALKELAIDICEERGIPYQLSQLSGGGTDAGAIHISNVGCPSIVLTVPTRHIHSPTGLLDMGDVESAISLVVELVKVLDKETLEGFTRL